LEGFIALKLGG